MSTIIPNLSEEVKLLVEKVTALSALYADAQQKLVHYQENQQVLEMQVDNQIEIQEHSDKLQSLIAKGNEQINNLMLEKGKLLQERDEAQQLTEGQQSVIQFLNQDIDQLRLSIEEKDETIDIFNQQKREWIKENQKLKDEVVQLRAMAEKYNSLKAENTRCISEKEELSTEIELLNEEIDRLSKK
ncbi:MULTISPECIES: hypothetical protein [Flammeovirga]|uniref:Uncharacterized protein n=1 Tax=Flammeovirga agarivorans TaxID=2726742 RepID=A0A7X8SHC4_9BACT|nr:MULTISPECIES: hypothetical protein [Flammeovirga]NLR90162.1 hypothetical protein [Flammeovirga agarivorans]